MYVHRHAKNNDFPIDFTIFTKALRTDGPTDQRTNGPTDRRTDKPSYRDAIAASKKIMDLVFQYLFVIHI